MQLRDKEALVTLLHMGLFEDEWHSLEWRGLYVVLFVTTERLNQRGHSKESYRIKVIYIPDFKTSILFKP